MPFATPIGGTGGGLGWGGLGGGGLGGGGLGGGGLGGGGLGGGGLGGGGLGGDGLGKGVGGGGDGGGGLGGGGLGGGNGGGGLGGGGLGGRLGGGGAGVLAMQYLLVSVELMLQSSEPLRERFQRSISAMPKSLISGGVAATAMPPVLMPNAVGAVSPVSPEFR